ncbi:hypothetical protein [Mesorhizobium sangaii]|jgi:glucose dehydrogenase|uniref:Glucose dehydrogenase n=1 Tax=Mesorhizobium sangaii TaxID=505389 RepID=A0A841P5U1_9HYPH|nr:hypothetical protein [Mesorhizobium sangaii]MBB6410694.1 glucose dehydrogenase [Mesorhizobium sangaii]
MLGVLLLLPPMVRSLHRIDTGSARYNGTSRLLAASLVIAVLAGVYTMFQSPHDVAGTFADDRTRRETLKAPFRMANGRLTAALRPVTVLPSSLRKTSAI